MRLHLTPRRSVLVLLLMSLVLMPVLAQPASGARCKVTKKDLDGDCVTNTKDRDIDQDGIANHRDANMDGDRQKNSADLDLDGDRVENTKDKAPFGVMVKRTRFGRFAPGRVVITLTTRDALKTIPASVRVPRSFFGLVAEDVLAQTGPAGAPMTADVAGSGAGLLRQTFSWKQIEPRPGVLDFTMYDNFVADAARNNIDVLPILFDPPTFRSSAPPRNAGRATYPPKSNDEFARFSAALVARYGPGGSFWQARPELPARPIRSWQVWNEPNLPAYWGGAPDARAYTRMLKLAHTAIRAVDPTATVVTAGLPDSRLGASPGTFLRRMYAAGAKGSFDALAANPYATTADGVLQILRGLRRQMNAKRDRAEIWVTEIGWATTRSKAPFDGTAALQAARITQTIGLLARNARSLKLRGIVYYAWRDLPVYAGGKDFWGLHTGLRYQNGRPKPAYAAVRNLMARLGS